MMRYEISGDPVAWASHRGFGKKSFNPNYIKKKAAKWELALQHGKNPLFTKAVRVDFFFEVRCPKKMPKKILFKIQNGEKVYCTKRPDCSNYRKHIEDCLTGTVILDDNIVVAGQTEKYYAKSLPRTIIQVEEINE